MPTSSAFRSTSPRSRWSRRRSRRARRSRSRASRPERDALEIRFPRVEGYRVELPDERLDGRLQRRLTSWSSRPNWSGRRSPGIQGIIGEGVDLSARASWATCARRRSLFHLTKRLLYTKWRDPGEEPKLHLFGQLKRITEQWLDDGYLVCKGGTYPAQLMYQELADMACERITAAITGRCRRAPDQGDARPVQPHWLDRARQLHHLEGRPLGDRRPTAEMPRELGRARLATGRRSSAASPRRTRACAPTSRTTTSGLEVPYRYGSDDAPLPARLHRPGGRRPRPDDPLTWSSRSRATAARMPRRRRQPMETYWVPGVNNLGQLRPLGFRRVHGDRIEIEAEFDTGSRSTQAGVRQTRQLDADGSRYFDEASRCGKRALYRRASRMYAMVIEAPLRREAQGDCRIHESEGEILRPSADAARVLRCASQLRVTRDGGPQCVSSSRFVERIEP